MLGIAVGWILLAGLVTVAGAATTRWLILPRVDVGAAGAAYLDARIATWRGTVPWGSWPGWVFSSSGSSPSSPGQYQTRHIFTEVGEYGSVLSFKKGDDSEVHSVDFNFNINDRSSLEIPGRRGGR